MLTPRYGHQLLLAREHAQKRARRIGRRLLPTEHRLKQEPMAIYMSVWVLVRCFEVNL